MKDGEARKVPEDDGSTGRVGCVGQRPDVEEALRRLADDTLDSEIPAAWADLVRRLTRRA